MKRLGLALLPYLMLAGEALAQTAPNTDAVTGRNTTATYSGWLWAVAIIVVALALIWYVRRGRAPRT